MKGAFLAAIGALVIGLSAAGLMENAGRAGPFDESLEPVMSDARVAGTWQAAPGRAIPSFCLEPPCGPRAVLDLRLEGLPEAAYHAHLEGATREELGALSPQGDAYVMRWSDATDHTDKRRLAITIAGQTVGSLPLGPAEDPVRLDGPLTLAWRALGGSVRVSEIGGFTVSTVATVMVDALAPSGWSFHASLEGPNGVVELGPLEGIAGASGLEARIERLPLEDQERLVVSLRHEDGPGNAAMGRGGAHGFPVLQARF